MYNFKDQVVVVTGGTRGIGRAISQRFLEEGAFVMAIYRSNDEEAHRFKEGLGALSEKLELRKFNISEGEGVKAFFVWLDEKYQRCDILVNNGGVRRDQILAMMNEEDWDIVMEINLKGTYLMSQSAILLMMKKRYGRIINISSMGGVLGLSGQSNYAASKAGQVALSRSLSKEVAKRNITVNNVSPGFIKTELISDLSKEQLEEYRKIIPMKRLGAPEDVADAVAFLASKKASYITGVNLEVSGGLL